MKENFESLVEHLIGGGFFLEEAVELLENRLIRSALERTNGNQSAASKLLGIHRNTLQRKMVQYEVSGARSRRKPVAADRSRTRVQARSLRAG
jgi:DNA-binding NtrC family response regulator